MSELWRFVYIESHVTLHAKADAQKVNSMTKHNRLNAPINVNPVGGGGSAGKVRGFDAWDYPRCRAFDRVKRPRGRDI